MPLEALEAKLEIMKSVAYNEVDLEAEKKFCLQ